MKMCTVKILVDILTYVATGKERREGKKKLKKKTQNVTIKTIKSVIIRVDIKINDITFI